MLARWLAALLIVGAGLAAYHNSFGGPFVFDDVEAVLTNPSIRDLGAVGDVLAPQARGGVTVGGRPLVNLSFAVNYAWGGEAVAGYHAVNLLIHLAAGLALFGLVRRTVPRLGGVPGIAPATTLWLAAAIAALWVVHPLQTSAVTYLVQRAESLMALCYLITLYAFVRAMDEPVAARRWLGVSVAACLAGMSSKEVMASAPLMVLLYDRTFVAGSFAAAWRQRWRYYGALASTWLLLVWLVASTAGRGGTAGFGTEVSVWSYLLTQCAAVVRYVWLVVWPERLVFDYGTATVSGLAAVWAQALGLLAAFGATLIALKRWPVAGFLGASFFAILAPSSSFVPVATQTMAEHRFYLPLAVVMSGLGVGAYRWLGRGAWVGLAAVGVLWTGLTVARNRDYQSEMRLWSDTVAKWPTNARAHNNLGKAVLNTGDAATAITHYDEAMHRDPAAPEPVYNRGVALARLGRTEEAIRSYEEALRLQPAYADAHNALGNAWLAAGQHASALVHHGQAVTLQPASAEFRSNLANVLLEAGRGSEAIGAAREAVRLDANYAAARYNLGSALAQSGALVEALPQFQEAVRLKPDYADAFNNLANVLLELDRVPEAIAAYEQALRLQPELKPARRNLAMVLVHLGRTNAAISHFQVLLQLDPNDAQARAALAELASRGR